MNRIDKNNFEAFFLDYHEGNLGSEEKQMVMAFLRDNPELFDVFEEYQPVILPVPDINYPNKSELYRTDVQIPGADDWEFKCIQYLEGDLPENEMEEFQEALKTDPEKAKILNLYLSTKAVPDTSIQYGDKQALKKKVVLIPRWVYGAVSAAAVIILGWIIFTPSFDNTNGDDRKIAEGSTRDTVVVDKVSPPENYRAIASADVQPATLKGTSIKPDIKFVVEETPDVQPEESIARETFAMAAISHPDFAGVQSYRHEDPPSALMFSYRFIPDIQDEQYQTLLAFSGDFARKRFLGQDPELVKKSKFSLWELADAGLEKISSIFGTRADIEREYSESGELLAISFESPLVGFNTPVRKRAQAQID